MTAKEARDLLKPIPEENFIENRFTDGVGKCCVVGHLVRLTSSNPHDYSIDNCNDFDRSLPIRETSAEFMGRKHGLYVDIATINNTYSGYLHYNEKSPKKRVIHLLDDMIEAGY